MLFAKLSLLFCFVGVSVVAPFVLSSWLTVFWATSPYVGRNATILLGSSPICMLLGVKPQSRLRKVLRRKSMSLKQTTTIKYEAQTGDSPLLETIKKIFKDTGLTPSKLVMFCNTLVVILTLSISVLKKGIRNSSTLILLPLATSVVSLAYVIYEAEGIEIPSYLTPSFLIEMLSPQTTQHSVTKINQMVAEANIGASIKKRTFISQETFSDYFNTHLGEKQIPFLYFSDLIRDHGMETVIRTYNADSTQIKILMLCPLDGQLTPELNENLQRQARDIRKAAPVTSTSSGYRYVAQSEARLSLKLIIGAVGLCILPLISGLFDRFDSATNIIKASRVLDATSKFSGHLDTIGDMILGWLGVAPETFSDEYHIANYTADLNKYLSTPTNVMLSNPILLSDFKSCVFETDLYMRKVRQTELHKITGLRGLHTASSSHLAALLRTSQLAGSRQEPALVLFYGEEASGKTRLSKEVIRRFTTKMFPEVPEDRRCIEITASNKYWPGLSGQPTLFADECDARGKEESLIFKNIKGLCSTAIFNCEGSANEHKHQPAPFKMLFGTTNCSIESLRDLINEYYGRDSLKAVWSRIILVNCKRNKAKYGIVDVLQRESARFDTTGGFDHVVISLHEWDEATQLPKTNRVVTLAQVVQEVEDKYTRLKTQFENPVFQSQSTSGKMSIAILGRSGVGKTDYVTSDLAPQLRAQFSLGVERKPKLIINDDKFQQKLMKPNDYIISYDEQPDSSVFVNIENLDGMSSPVPLTIHAEYQYTSCRIGLKVKSDLQAFPRRFGVYPKMFSGLWNYFIWFGRRECWIDPSIEIGYVNILLFLSSFLVAFSFLASFLMLISYCMYSFIMIKKFGLYPISVECNSIPTENLTAHIISQYKKMTKHKRELIVSEMPAPQFTPNIALSLTSLEDLQTFNKSPLSCLYYDYTRYLNSTKNAKMYVTKEVAANLVRHIAELSFSSITEDIATHENVIRRFARLFTTLNLPLSLQVIFKDRIYSVHDNVFYKVTSVIHNDEICDDGVVINGNLISWEDVAKYQLHLVTLDELFKDQGNLDFVAISMKMQTLFNNEKCILARQHISSLNIQVAQNVSKEVWDKAYEYFTGTVCGRVIVGLVLVYAAYNAAKLVLTDDNSDVEYEEQAHNKRKVGGRKKKTYVDTDSEAERIPRNLQNASSIDTSDEEGPKKQAKGKRKIGSRKNKNYTKTDDSDIDIRVNRQKFQRQAKIKSQSILTIPDMNGDSGLTPGKQVLDNIHKNLVHVYAVEKGYDLDVIKHLDEVNFNTMFTRNYGIFIKGGIVITVGHLLGKNSGCDIYVMSDELRGNKEYNAPIAKANVVKQYKDRDVMAVHVPALVGKMKDISSKLISSPPDEMYGNVLLARYGPKKQREYFSGYMTYNPGLELITDVEGHVIRASKHLTTFFTVTQVDLTFGGDCGLPYVHCYQGAWKLLSIHAMATTQTETYHSISSCFFKDDLDNIIETYKVQTQECVGCTHAGKWIKASTPSDKAVENTHEIYWNTEHDNDLTVSSELLSVAKINKNDGYEYSFGIGDDAPATVPGHAHIHRYKPKMPMNRERKFATDDDKTFSAIFHSVWMFGHFIYRQLPYKSYRTWFDFNGETLYAFFSVSDVGDAQIIPFSKMTTLSAVKWMQHSKFIPKTATGIIRDPEKEPFFTSKLHNIETERVKPICRVKGKNIPFKTKIKPTPYQGLVTFPVRKFPFDANDQTDHPEKLINANGYFDPLLCHIKDYAPTPPECDLTIRSVLMAHEGFFLSMFKKYKNLRELSDEEVLYGIDRKSNLTGGMGRLEVDTSAGFSLQTNYDVFKKSDIISLSDDGTYTWNENPAATDLKEDYQKACEAIRKGNDVFVVNCELLKDEKLKQQKLYKGRQYSCADFLSVLLERKFLGKMVAISTVQDEEVAVGIDPILDFNTLNFRMNKHKNHYTVDFSTWDKTIPAAAFKYFFQILKKLNPSYVNELNALSSMYETSYHVTDNILFSTDGSLPSGCYTTASLNSLLNNFLVAVVYCILAETNNVTPTLLHFRENIEQVAYGDDKWISTSLYWFSMIDLEDKFKLFGMKMGSSEKGEKLKPFMPLNEISFISRYPRQLATGVWSGALKKITIESLFHWTTDTSWPHLGLLISLASYESCLWSFDYVTQVEENIAKILYKCPMLKAFVYMFDPVTVSEDIHNKSLIKFILESRGETSTLDLLTRHRMLRRLVLKLNLKVNSERKVIGTYTPIRKNKTMSSNDLQWLNEWAQKTKKTLCWAHARLPCMSMCDLQVHEGDWVKESFAAPLHSFQATGVNKNVAKHNCASIAKQHLLKQVLQSGLEAQSGKCIKEFCCKLRCKPVSIATSNYLLCGCQGACICSCKTQQKNQQHMDKIFQTYPKTWKMNAPVQPYQLAAANFRYEENDEDPDCVICDLCGLTVSEWSFGDDPLVIHEMESRNCPFIIKTIFNRSKYVCQSGRGEGINVTHADQVPVAQTSSLDPTLAMGNTFYTNTRVAVGADIINPLAIALNNPCGTGAPFDKKEAVFNLYQPWFTTSVNGAQAEGTEVLRISLDPATLPPSIREYYDFHKDFVPAIDVAIFINGTAGGLGTLVLAWVPDAAADKVYTLQQLYNVSNKTMSLAQTTATQQILTDNRKNGMFRTREDPEPYPGLILMIDAPATNVQRNDTVNFPIRVYVRLPAEHCQLMSPFQSIGGVVSSSDIPLSAFLTETSFDATVTGPGALEIPPSITLADKGWNTGNFEPLPLGAENIWACSTTNPLPSSYKLLVDYHATPDDIRAAIALTEFENPRGLQIDPRFKGPVDINANIPDVLYIAYGTVPAVPTTTFVDTIPGTKTRIPKITTYLQDPNGIKYDCDTVYVQAGGIGLLMEWKMRGTWTTMTHNSYMWQIFTITDGRLPQNQGSQVGFGEFVFPAAFNPVDLDPAPLWFAVMGSYLPTRAVSNPIRWPMFSSRTGNTPLLFFVKSANLSWNGSPIRETETLRSATNHVGPLSFISETSTGHQIALPNAMSLLTFSRVGYASLPTNFSVGTQPPATPGSSNLYRFLDSMLASLNTDYLTFGLKFGKSQVEMIACYGFGRLMVRSVSNIQRVALSPTDCYITAIKAIPNPTSVAALISNISSWRSAQVSLQSQMFSPIAAGVGAGLSALANGMWANDARNFNAQLALQLQNLKNKSMIDLENQKFNNNMSLYGAASQSMQSATRPSYNIAPTVKEPLNQGSVTFNPIGFQHGVGTNVEATPFVPGTSTHHIAEPLSQDEKIVYS